jgi:hypothetical protein
VFWALFHYQSCQSLTLQQWRDALNLVLIKRRFPTRKELGSNQSRMRYHLLIPDIFFCKLGIEEFFDSLKSWRAGVINGHHLCLHQIIYGCTKKIWNQTIGSVDLVIIH